MFLEAQVLQNLLKCGIPEIFFRGKINIRVVVTGLEVNDIFKTYEL